MFLTALLINIAMRCKNDSIQFLVCAVDRNQITVSVVDPNLRTNTLLRSSPLVSGEVAGLGNEYLSVSGSPTVGVVAASFLNILYGPPLFGQKSDFSNLLLNTKDRDVVPGPRLAMSKDGRQLAYIRNSIQMIIQGGFMSYESVEGDLVVRDMPTGDEKVVAQKVSNAGIDWFPNGKELVVVKHTAYSSLSKSEQWKLRGQIEKAQLRDTFTKDKFLSIYVVDVKSKISRWVGMGTSPKVSNDSTYLIADTGFPHERLLRYKMGGSAPDVIQLPENSMGEVVYFKPGEALVYRSFHNSRVDGQLIVGGGGEDSYGSNWTDIRRLNLLDGRDRLLFQVYCPGASQPVSVIDHLPVSGSQE